MLRVTETFNSVIDQITYGPDLKLVTLFGIENANLTQEDLNTSIDKAENRSNLNHVPYDMLSSGAKTIKQRPALLLSMEFWGFWWVPLEQDKTQCGLANRHESDNWIQTSSNSYAGNPFTLWLVPSDDVAGFRCAWTSSGWYCDGKAWCRGFVFWCEEFVACYPDQRRSSSTGCDAPDDTDCNSLDHKKVVGIQTRQWKTTLSDPEGECTPYQSGVDWRRASEAEDQGGEIHYSGCFRSTESLQMAASMDFSSAGRHWDWGLQQCFWTVVQWLATRYSGGLSNFPIVEGDISANTYQLTSGVSQTWPRQRINISEMYFSHWKPPGVSERMWSVNLEASISGGYLTLGGHSSPPSE